MSVSAKRLDVLYISYDGLLEPLGKAQILPYLKGLTKKGSKFLVLSFEKGNFSTSNDVWQLKKELDYRGIGWKRLRYHKRPFVLATVFDIFCGTLISFWFIKRYRVKIIHARSYVPSLMSLILKRICKVKFIFDMRGFWADERIEAGIWKKGNPLFRIAKYFEKIFLQNADTIVSLTRVAKNEIETYPYLSNKKMNITCIPTCVDLDRFAYKRVRDLQKSQKIKGRPLFVYSGSISTWFMPQVMFDFFAVVKKDLPKAHLLVLTREELLLREILQMHAVIEDSVSVVSADYESVPDYLSKAQVGLAFYRPGYSRRGCCPTKIGEYLGCGLPVIINAGVGDTDEILKIERIGIIIEEFSDAEYERVNKELKELLKDNQLESRCHKAAERYFGLNDGMEKYQKIYYNLLKT